MLPTVHGYMECVSNPVGNFASLEGIYPLRNNDGTPVFTVHSHTVNFRVVWKGDDHILKCFTSAPDAAMERARLAAERLGRSDAPYAAGYSYLEEEIAVADSMGRVSMYDVVLQRVPAGCILHGFVQERCDKRDTGGLRALLEGFGQMAEWLRSSGIVHRNIKPSNIYVTPQGRPVLINFDFAQVSAQGFFPEPGADNRSLAGIALIITLAICDPDIYRHLGGIKAFGKESLRRIAAAIAQDAEADGLLKALAETAQGKTEGSPKAPAEIAQGETEASLKAPVETAQGEAEGSLKALAEAAQGKTDGSLKAPAETAQGETEREKLEELILLAVRTPLSPQTIPGGVTQYPENETEAGGGEVRYDRIAGSDRPPTPVRDTDGKWLYIDNTGKPAHGRKYSFAEEFADERAVAGIDSYATMIDRHGNALIPSGFDEVVWDEPTGIACACREGKWGLFDRYGKQLTPVIYDWVSLWSEGLLLAQLEDKFGFLDRKGNTAVGFLYDSAYSFRDGSALVSVGGKEFRINGSGETIEE